MNDFIRQIKELQVPKGKAAIASVGQAGFIIKGSDGRLTALDLYLSDCCERYFGFRRMLPAPFKASELVFDVIIATHAHYDHFDIDAMPELMKNDKTQLYTSTQGYNEYLALGLNIDRVKKMKPGSVMINGGMHIEAVYCDHGQLAPDAFGVIIESDNKRIYYAGDTALNRALSSDKKIRNADVMIAPINGTYGNMNEEEAINLVGILKPRLMIPCHTGMFAEHGGSTTRFSELISKLLPHQDHKIMLPKDIILI